MSRDDQYVVVARRYRPQSFEDLVGQNQVAQALNNAIATNRVGHAYLFTGARGVGKTSTARIFAKALNCEKGPTSTPCNECEICRGIASGEDVDVLEIDGASNRGIDEIRQLRSNVNVRPSRTRFKIYIIDEVHMLTTPAFNALLKTLEEPPEHVKFMFCTTDPEKIPIKVLSRCQRFDFAPVETASIIDRLAYIVKNEGVEAEPEALQMLARRAAGSMRDSQSLLEQLLSFCGERITADDVHQMLGAAKGGRLSAIADALIGRHAAQALQEVDAALGEGVDAGQLAGQMLGHFRDMMTAAVGCSPEMLLHTNPDQHEAMAEQGKQFGLSALLAVVQILDQAIARMRQTTQTRTLLEVAVVQISQLADLEELSAVVAELRGAGGGEGESPAKPAAKSSPRAPSKAPVKSAEKKTPEPPQTGAPPTTPSSVAVDLTTANAASVWSQALAQLEDMTRDFAACSERVAISAPNRLVVYFKTSYNLQKESCERVDRRAKIEQALAKVCGSKLDVDFELLPEDAKSTEQKKPILNRRQQLREKEKHPLVSEAIEIFDAELLRLESSKTDAKPPPNDLPPP